jgi:uncharacterized SAM-binding protein YcdF (DUF218 family)
MRRRVVILTAVIGFLFLAYLTAPFILTKIGSWLIVRDQLTKADLIIILGGDDNGERAIEGVKLYKAGYAPKIMLSGGPLAWHLTSADWMRKEVIALGVPSNKTLVQNKSRSTLQDAQFTLPLVKQLKAKKILLVTSPTHSRRAKRIFNKLFGKEKIAVVSWPATVSDFKLDRWWTRYEDRALVVWEYVSFPLYLLKGY